jgi:hypothetical protein
VPLAEGDAVEAELLGVAGRGEGLGEPLVGADLTPGHRVPEVGQDV